MAGFVVRDNSLPVAEAAASGNGVTTPCESPVAATRPTGCRLKRVCILDEDQNRLARKQPIHRTPFSRDPPAIYTLDFVTTGRHILRVYTLDPANYFLSGKVFATYLLLRNVVRYLISCYILTVVGTSRAECSFQSAIRRAKRHV